MERKLSRPPALGTANASIEVKELPKQRPSSNFLPQTTFSVQVPLPPPPSSLPAHVKQQLAQSANGPPPSLPPHPKASVNSATARHIPSNPQSSVAVYNQTARHQMPPAPPTRGDSPQSGGSSPTPASQPKPPARSPDSLSSENSTNARKAPVTTPTLSNAPAAPPRSANPPPGMHPATVAVSTSKSAPSVAQQISTSYSNTNNYGSGSNGAKASAPMPPPRAFTPNTEPPIREKRSGSFPEKVQLPPPIPSGTIIPSSTGGASQEQYDSRARAGTVDSHSINRNRPPLPAPPSASSASSSASSSSSVAPAISPRGSPTAKPHAVNSKPPPTVLAAPVAKQRPLPNGVASGVSVTQQPIQKPPTVTNSTPSALNTSFSSVRPTTAPPPSTSPVPPTRSVPSPSPPTSSAANSKPPPAAVAAGATAALKMSTGERPSAQKPPSPRGGGNLPAAPPRPPARKPMRYQPVTPTAAAVPTAPQVTPHSTHSVFSAEPIPNAAPITNTYQLGEPLGSGGFAEVVQAKHKQSGRRVAVKIIDKEVTCMADANALKTEIDVLRRLQHPHILRFEEVFDTPNKLYVVTELLEGGELLYQLEGNQQHGAVYTENDARRITRQILEATAYLHLNGVVHRDLKPENLLFIDKSPTAGIKLIDFGLAKSFAPGEMLSDWCGTPEYQPPEMIKRAGYGPKADVWSIGVILYILLAGRPPFRDSNKMRLYSKIIAANLEFPPEHFGSVSDLAVDLLRKLLSPDPNARFNCDEALRHPWVQGGGTGVAPATPIASMQDLHKFNMSRRFQNTGKQLMTCQRFSLLAKEEAAQDSIARNQFSP